MQATSRPVVTRWLVEGGSVDRTVELRRVSGQYETRILEAGRTIASLGQESMIGRLPPLRLVDLFTAVPSQDLSQIVFGLATVWDEGECAVAYWSSVSTLEWLLVTQAGLIELSHDQLVDFLPVFHEGGKLWELSKRAQWMCQPGRLTVQRDPPSLRFEAPHEDRPVASYIKVLLEGGFYWPVSISPLATVGELTVRVREVLGCGGFTGLLKKGPTKKGPMQGWPRCNQPLIDLGPGHPITCQYLQSKGGSGSPSALFSFGFGRPSEKSKKVSCYTPEIRQMGVEPGFNIVGLCRYEGCQRGNTWVWVSHGFGTIEVAEAIARALCSSCERPLEEVKGGGFHNCEFVTKGQLEEESEPSTYKGKVSGEKFLEFMGEELEAWHWLQVTTTPLPDKKCSIQ